MTKALLAVPLLLFPVFLPTHGNSAQGGYSYVGAHDTQARYPAESYFQLYQGDSEFWGEFRRYAADKAWKPQPWAYEASPRIHSSFGHVMWYALDVFDSKPEYLTLLRGQIGTRHWTRFREEISRLSPRFPELKARVAAMDAALS